MTRETEGRPGGRRPAARGISILLLACGLPAITSCADFRGADAGARLLPLDRGLSTQEGEVTLRDGEETVVGFPKPFQSPPRVTVVEFRQSWFKEKPYAKGDFQVVQQEPAWFKVRNNHPEQGQGAAATVKWRAEGVLAARPPAAPAPPAPGAKWTRDQIVARIKSARGTVVCDPRLPNGPVTGIDLHNTKVADADLELLRDLTDLRTLNLSGTGITDAGLKSVGGLTGLQTLLLNETAVTDAGLQHLHQLTELRELSLYHARVTDEGLTSLKGLTNLRDLTLSGDWITDKGLRELKGLRNLRHLFLSRTGVTPAGVQEFKKASPHAEVIQ
jgi:hypothetical protein